MLSKQIEDERKARVEIEASVAWRRLTEAQQRNIGSTLSHFSGIVGSFWFNAGDDEGALFASDMFEAVGYARWNRLTPAAKLDFPGANTGRFVVQTGVVVTSTSDEPSREAANRLVHQLVGFGFDTNLDEKTDTRTTPMVIVTVEARPQGPQGHAKLDHATLH